MKPTDTSDPQPHDDAPLWVWHAWLVHNSDAQGGNGWRCPDGCDHAPDPMRAKIYHADE